MKNGNPHIPALETQTPAAIRAEQNKRLQVLLAYLQAHSPFYRAHFARHGIQVSRIETVEDLVHIPPVGKDELLAHNWEFLCVDRSKVLEYTTTSGTLGKPVAVALTENDLERLAYNESLSFACADGSTGDLYQLMLTLDRQFMAGMAYYTGIRRLGAGLIRTGPGLPALQWEAIQRFAPNALVAVPSFILKLIDFAEEHGIDYRAASVKKVICIGENIRHADGALNNLGKKIRQQWDLQLYSTYASTEMQTAFTECRFGAGGHHHPELLIVEFLDENDRPVPPGEFGQVTISTLGVEGMPLLRYKTGDICTRWEEPCACGRTTFRISPVLGRKNQMIKYKGTTLYPPALFDVLQELPEVHDYVVRVFRNDLETDEISLYLSVSNPSAELNLKIRSHVQSKLRVLPNIQYCDIGDLQKMQFPDNSRKAVKFIDQR